MFRYLEIESLSQAMPREEVSALYPDHRQNVSGHINSRKMRKAEKDASDGKCLGGFLADGRILSMFNTDCICMKCKAKERMEPDYKKAQEKEMEAVLAGDYNFPGIGLKNKEVEQ